MVAALHISGSHFKPCYDRGSFWFKMNLQNDTIVSCFELELIKHSMYGYIHWILLGSFIFLTYTYFSSVFFLNLQVWLQFFITKNLLTLKFSIGHFLKITGRVLLKETQSSYKGSTWKSKFLSDWLAYTWLA